IEEKTARGQISSDQRGAAGFGCGSDNFGKAVHPVRFDTVSRTQSHSRSSHGVKKRILAIDVGGSNVKLMISRWEKRKFKSGPDLTPREMVAQMKTLVRDWSFDGISMGFPAPIRNGRIMSEPKHLGPGWTRFDYEKSLGKPIRIINDAAMQALGSFHGGRMLFL